MKYTSDEIKSSKFYTDNCNWIDTEMIAIAINKCSSDGMIHKGDLLKELQMDDEYIFNEVTQNLMKKEGEQRKGVVRD